MTREELYEKYDKKSDGIVRIIGLHALDTAYGNKRDELNLVDGMYPAIEGMFTLDVCLEAIGNNNILKEYYDKNYDTNVDYNTFSNYFNQAQDIINKEVKDEDGVMEVCNQLIKLCEDVYKTKKEEKRKSM